MGERSLRPYEPGKAGLPTARYICLGCEQTFGSTMGIRNHLVTTRHHPIEVVEKFSGPAQTLLFEALRVDNLDGRNIPSGRRA